MIANDNRNISGLIARACETVKEPGAAAQAALLSRLHCLIERLETDRFQLASVGQFKRGKSSLLNALLGEALLPTSAIPATANATFIKAGQARELFLKFNSGRNETDRFTDSASLAKRLAQVVTEESNPKNVLGLERVEVAMPAPLLGRGVVLIDTPGIGSTHLHNSVAAKAALAECDAALFVLSVDPPMTEIEAEYYREVRGAAARVIVVLNKIDTVDDEDRQAVLAFLQRALAEQVGAGHAPELFAVSAREALRAKLTGDKGALARSGLDKLESHIANLLERDKVIVLRTAIASKAVQLVARLRLDADIRLKALQLPLNELERRIAAFEHAIVDFERERQSSHDLLAGDLRRALEALDRICERTYEKARQVLRPELEGPVKRAPTFDAARTLVEEAIEDFFDKALQTAIAELHSHVDRTFSNHRQRADQLVLLVQGTAAEIMNVSAPKTLEEEEFLPEREPFWVRSGQVDTLGSLFLDSLMKFLPQSVRQRRMRRMLLDGIGRAIVRNVSNLQWAMNQNLQDTFRRYEAFLDGRLTASLEETHGAMLLARKQKVDEEPSLERELKVCAACSLELHRVEIELRSAP